MTSRGERWFVAVVFGLYAAATLVVALHHEPWRDEADPWLLIRDGGVSTMLARTGFVGMPALWYLALAPVVKMGLPYAAMTLLNLAFAWAAALLFLVVAPLPRLVRVLFLFSYFMLFEYAVIARPYAIGMLLLFGALAAWRHRASKPLPFATCVALLANTTPHMLFIAAVLGLMYVLRGERSRLAIAVMLLGGLLSVAQLWPPAGAPARHIARRTDIAAVRSAVSGAIFPRMRVRFGWAVGAGVIVSAALAIGKRPAPQIFLWGSLAALGAIFTFVWMGGARHAGLIFLVLFGALWLALQEGRLRAQPELMVMLNVVLAIGVISGATNALRDIRLPFSGSAEMAEHLVRTGLVKYPIAAHSPGPAQALLPYLPQTKFYYAGAGRWGTYMLWDEPYSRAAKMTTAAAAAMAREHFGDRPFLIMVNRPLADKRRYRLLYTTRRPFGYADEQYFLYRSEGR